MEGTASLVEIDSRNQVAFARSRGKLGENVARSPASTPGLAQSLFHWFATTRREMCLFECRFRAAPGFGAVRPGRGSRTR